MTLVHAPALGGKPCAGCSKFPTYIDYNAHGIDMRKAHTKAGPEYQFNITHRAHKVTLLQTKFSYIKVKVIQSSNSGNKTKHEINMRGHP
jgi:Ni,Fe-hydrogenase I small subunit